MIKNDLFINLVWKHKFNTLGLLIVLGLYLSFSLTTFLWVIFYLVGCFLSFYRMLGFEYELYESLSNLKYRNNIDFFFKSNSARLNLLLFLFS